MGPKKKKSEAASAGAASSNPKAVKLKKALPPTHIQKVGTQLDLIVEAENNGKPCTFSWEHPSWTSGEEEGRIVFQSDAANGVSTCTVAPVQIQDEGDWRCSLGVGERGAQATTTTCSLVVYVPKSYRIPTFLEELEAKVSTNGTVALECKVIGVPTPRLIWYKDDKELNAGDSYELRAENNKPTTTYKCVAVNCVGSALSETVLQMGSPKVAHASQVAPKMLIGMADVRKKIGTDVELYIKVNDESLPCTASWKHNSAAVISTPKCLMIQKGPEFKLVVRGLEISDDGDWACTVENPLGSFTDKCRVTLKVPKNYRVPVFVEKLRANLTDEGLDLKPGDVYQLYGNQSIGVYTCVARNCMGEARSTSSLTVEDLEKKPKKAIQISIPLQDCNVKYGEPCQLFVKVSTSLQLPFVWKRNGLEVGFPEYVIGCEEDGKYFCNITQAGKEDEGSWEIALEDGDEQLTSFCVLKVLIPKHFKAPRFLEDLQVALGPEGNVSLECKVIGIPQPSLTWYKDDKELKAGDLHQLMAGGEAGADAKTCVFGTYQCVAENCMGQAVSTATLLGIGDETDPSLSTAPSVANDDSLVMQTALEELPVQASSIKEVTSESQLQHRRSSSGSRKDKSKKTEVTQDVFEELDVSASFQGKSVMLSMSDVPDISASDAQQIVEMFADQLAESITEDNMVELPPLRFVRETSRSEKVNMEAMVIDIDEEEMEQVEQLRATLEAVDDLKTEADLDDLSGSEPDWGSDQEEEGRKQTANGDALDEDLYATPNKIKKSKDSEKQPEELLKDDEQKEAAKEIDRVTNSKEQQDQGPIGQKEVPSPKEEESKEADKSEKTEEQPVSGEARTETSELSTTEPKTVEEVKSKVAEMSQSAEKEQQAEEREPLATEQASQLEDLKAPEVLLKEVEEPLKMEQIPELSKGVKEGKIIEPCEVKDPETQNGHAAAVESPIIEEEVAVMEKPKLESGPPPLPQPVPREWEAVPLPEGQVAADRSPSPVPIVEEPEEEDLVVRKFLEKEARGLESAVAEMEKDLASLEELDDPEFDEEMARRRRSRSASYEETLQMMDPELLQELGLTPEGKQVEVSETPEEKDLTTKIEAMAKELVKEIPSNVATPAEIARRRSRSRSKSRPPNLDTVEENYSQEYQESLYYTRQQASLLHDIKECPSGASINTSPSGTGLNQSKSGASINNSASGTGLNQSKSGASINSSPSGTGLNQSKAGTSLEPSASSGSGLNHAEKAPERGSTLNDHVFPQSNGAAAASVSLVFDDEPETYNEASYVKARKAAGNQEEPQDVESASSSCVVDICSSEAEAAPDTSCAQQQKQPPCLDAQVPCSSSTSSLPEHTVINTTSSTSLKHAGQSKEEESSVDKAITEAAKEPTTDQGPEHEDYNTSSKEPQAGAAQIMEEIATTDSKELLINKTKADIDKEEQEVPAEDVSLKAMLKEEVTAEEVEQSADDKKTSEPINDLKTDKILPLVRESMDSAKAAQTKDAEVTAHDSDTKDVMVVLDAQEAKSVEYITSTDLKGQDGKEAKGDGKIAEDVRATTDDAKATTEEEETKNDGNTVEAAEAATKAAKATTDVILEDGKSVDVVQDVKDLKVVDDVKTVAGVKLTNDAEETTSVREDQETIDAFKAPEDDNAVKHVQAVEDAKVTEYVKPVPVSEGQAAEDVEVKDGKAVKDTSDNMDVKDNKPVSDVNAASDKKDSSKGLVETKPTADIKDVITVAGGDQDAKVDRDTEDIQGAQVAQVLSMQGTKDTMNAEGINASNELVAFETAEDKTILAPESQKTDSPKDVSQEVTSSKQPRENLLETKILENIDQLCTSPTEPKYEADIESIAAKVEAKVEEAASNTIAADAASKSDESEQDFKMKMNEYEASEEQKHSPGDAKSLSIPDTPVRTTSLDEDVPPAYDTSDSEDELSVKTVESVSAQAKAAQQEKKNLVPEEWLTAAEPVIEAPCIAEEGLRLGQEQKGQQFSAQEVEEKTGQHILDVKLTSVQASKEEKQETVDKSWLQAQVSKEEIPSEDAIPDLLEVVRSKKDESEKELQEVAKQEEFKEFERAIKDELQADQISQGDDDKVGFQLSELREAKSATPEIKQQASKEAMAVSKADSIVKSDDPSSELSVSKDKDEAEVISEHKPTSANAGTASAGSETSSEPSKAPSQPQEESGIDTSIKASNKIADAVQDSQKPLAESLVSELSPRAQENQQVEDSLKPCRPQEVACEGSDNVQSAQAAKIDTDSALSANAVTKDASKELQSGLGETYVPNEVHELPSAEEKPTKAPRVKKSSSTKKMKQPKESEKLPEDASKSNQSHKAAAEAPELVQPEIVSEPTQAEVAVELKETPKPSSLEPAQPETMPEPTRPKRASKSPSIREAATSEAPNSTVDLSNVAAEPHEQNTTATDAPTEAPKDSVDNSMPINTDIEAPKSVEVDKHDDITLTKDKDSELCKEKKENEAKSSPGEHRKSPKGKKTPTTQRKKKIQIKKELASPAETRKLVQTVETTDQLFGTEPEQTEKQSEEKASAQPEEVRKPELPPHQEPHTQQQDPESVKPVNAEALQEKPADKPEEKQAKKPQEIREEVPQKSSESKPEVHSQDGPTSKTPESDRLKQLESSNDLNEEDIFMRSKLKAAERAGEELPRSKKASPRRPSKSNEESVRAPQRKTTKPKQPERPTRKTSKPKIDSVPLETPAPATPARKKKAAPETSSHEKAPEIKVQQPVIAADLEEERDEFGDQVAERKTLSGPEITGNENLVQVKEVGYDWVSLCWRRPESQSRGPAGKVAPVLTYKVEAWLCGEGAYWVEVGRSPITQFDVFHLKPNREYYFRVTAKSRHGIETEIMTKGRVDLSKATKRPSFQQELPAVLRVLQGKDLELQCKYGGEPAPEVRWIRSTPNRSSEVLEHTPAPDGSSVTLEAARVNDAGRYTCQLSNSAGTVSCSCQVEVLTDPALYNAYERAKSIMEGVEIPTKDTFPCFVVSPRDRRIEYGSSIQFMCKAVGYPPPEVKWLRQGEELESIGNVSISNDCGFSYLSLEEVGEEDVGTYHAVAHNAIGQTTARFLLVVDDGPQDHFAPQFISPLKNQELLPNTNLLLHTRISASPYVSVNWYKDGVKVRPSANAHKYFDRDGNATLAIVNQDCTGNYTCMATNEGGENTIAVAVEAAKDATSLHSSNSKPFKSLPTVHEISPGKLKVQCELVHSGDVYLSTVPKLDSKELNFTKSSNNTHCLELDSAKHNVYMGRVVYVIARCGVQGVIYPIKTDIEATEKTFNLAQDEVPSQIVCDNSQKVARSPSVPVEAFCRSGDRISMGLADPIDIQQNDTITLRRTNGENVSSRPSFVISPSEFQVLFKSVCREDEGTYEVTVSDKTTGATKKKFNYLLIVMDKSDYDLSRLLNNVNPDCPTPYVASKLRATPTSIWSATPRSTPRCSPGVTPRSTPMRGNTPVLNREPSAEVEDVHKIHNQLNLPCSRHPHVYPKILSGLTDVTTYPGQSSVELKCYVLTTPGLETRWEKDGRELTLSGRIRSFDSRGVRGLSLMSPREEDSGLYSVRITGKSVNLFSSCRVEVYSRHAPSPRASTSRFLRPYSSYSSYSSSSYSNPSSTRNSVERSLRAASGALSTRSSVDRSTSALGSSVTHSSYSYRSRLYSRNYY